MKKEFLVLYDYGQGGVWAFVNAHSKADIARRFPEFEIIDQRPKWMTSEVVARLRQRMSFDIDKPRGWLADVANKKRPPRDIAAG